MSQEFTEIRKTPGKENLANTSCYIEFVKEKISSRLVEVLENALKRSGEIDALDTSVSHALMGHNIGPMPRAQFEVLLLKEILDFEAGQHDEEDEWSVRSRGLETIQDKLDLLLDKYSNHHTEMISFLCDLWGEVFLTPEQETEISLLPEADRPNRIEAAVGDLLKTLWFFFVSICRVLQKDDYWMSAEEAYWLGLIDEVIGRTDLPCPRLFVEYPPTAAGETAE